MSEKIVNRSKVAKMYPSLIEKYGDVDYFKMRHLMQHFTGKELETRVNDMLVTNDPFAHVAEYCNDRLD